MIHLYEQHWNICTMTPLALFWLPPAFTTVLANLLLFSTHQMIPSWMT